jgi:23S rRNA pseudouridine955/2504/2580 synthase
MIAALYEDEEILVLDKPPGLASQPGEGVRLSVVEAVERDFGFRPFLVHRLDKETTGCLLVAKSSLSAARWARLIESRELGKTYRALVAGRPPLERGSFEEAVTTRSGDKAASTSYRLVAAFGGAPGGGAEGLYSFLELGLGTGRTHQIRIHLAGRGLPVLGDDRHGDFGLNKRLRGEAGLRRLMLHSRSLLLPGGRLVIAPMPPHFAAFMGLFPLAPDPESP